MTQLAQITTSGSRPPPVNEWGTWLAPDSGLEEEEDLVQALGLKVYSGHQAVHSLSQFRGFNPSFDLMVEQLKRFELSHEDQCSARYYYDLFQILQSLSGQYNRVAEVGVFMGGASVIAAGASQEFHFDLDLIDIDPRYLRFAYERIRRTFPGAESRVRLFYGGLPEYAAHVLVNSEDQVVIHHDGAHDFPQVVKDLSSLYFVRDAVHAIICQDTHLRGRANNMNFVDMALYAVFGLDLEGTAFGAVYTEEEKTMTNPNRYQGNYFVPGAPEGIALLLEDNTFRYPHPSMQLSEFLGDPPG